MRTTNFDQVQAGGDIHIGDTYLATPAGHPGCWVDVPQMRRPLVGRDALVEGLVARLVGGDCGVVAWDGLPGVGKSTLAVALAHHQAVLAHFRDGVLWAGLGRSPDVMSALATWAEALDADVSGITDVEERHRKVKRLIGQRRLLLVIDDAWDVESARRLRCGGPNACHILTTRDKTIARHFSGEGGSQTLAELAPAAAVDLLARMAPEAVAADPRATAELVQAVGGLPLALELVGAYLAAPELGPFPELAGEAMNELRDPGARLALAARRLGDLAGEYLTLEAVVRLGADALPPAVARAFDALGAFAPKPERFDREAALAVTDSDRRTLGLLWARNLLEYERESETFAMHQTLSDVAGTRLAPAAVRRHRDHYLACANHDWDDWRRIEAIYGQAGHAFAREPEEPALLEWVWALRTFQRRRGLVDDELAWAERGLGVAVANDLRDKQGTLLNNIGAAHDELGQRDEALAHYRRSLPIREEVDDRAGLAVTLNNIGAVHDKLDHMEEALAYYERALPLFETIGARDAHARSLSNIGLVYNRLGEYAKALEYHGRALEIQEASDDPAGRGATLSNMAMVYESLGQPEHALEHFDLALPIQEAIGDRPGVARTLRKQGSFHYTLGDMSDALSCLERSLAILESIDNRPELAETLRCLGLVHAARGQPDEALACHTRERPIREALGDRHGLAATLHNLGAANEQLQRPHEALACYDGARSIREQAGDRAALAVTINNMGHLHGTHDRPREALEHYGQALVLHESIDRPRARAVVLSNMGSAYLDLDDPGKALEHFEQALAIQAKERDRLGLAKTLLAIGDMYWDRGHPDEALDGFEGALAAQDGTGALVVEASARFKIATVLRSRGERGDALTHLRRVVEIDRELRSPHLEGDIALLAETEAAHRSQS